jgi:hypothetical protein
MAVNILDLSEGGVGVEAPVDIAGPGDAGYLVLDVAVVPLRVVAAQGGRLGLAFTAMSDVAAESVLRVLAEMHRRQKA